jgi:hypothetical protein
MDGWNEWSGWGVLQFLVQDGEQDFLRLPASKGAAKRANENEGTSPPRARQSLVPSSDQDTDLPSSWGGAGRGEPHPPSTLTLL